MKKFASFFSRLAQIAKTIEKEEGLEAPLYLSMGMSGDFETAIECGATHIRIGTSWFEREGRLMGFMNSLKKLLKSRR